MSVGAVSSASILSRRAALRAGAGGLAALATVSPVYAAELKGKTTLMTDKIDTHHHFLPKVYVDAIGLADLASVMPNKIAPQWSPQLALEMMDANGIREGVLSVSSGPAIPDAPTLLRKCNHAAADLRAQFPGRFGSFASLPLPDLGASLNEIAYSLDELKADGVIVFTNYDGRYLGDPHFSPVWEELNRRASIVFIHPNHPPYELANLPPASVIEFPFDTTRTAVSLLYAGALKRYPNIKFILSHAGGTLPYLAQRVAGGAMMNPALAERVGDPLAAMRSFYYDTALSASAPQIAALMTIADPAHILFGTDFPMAPSFAVAMTSQGVDHAPLEAGMKADIFRGNAARMLGRV